MTIPVNLPRGLSPFLIILAALAAGIDAPLAEAQPPGAGLPPQQVPPTGQQPPAPRTQAPSAPRGAQGAPAAPPRAPFELSKEQAEYLAQVLAIWEEHTSKIKTFKATFRRWEYDQQNREKSVADGELSYQSPDKGTYRIDKVFSPNAQGQLEEAAGEFREHWTTDGKVILEYDYINKRVVERAIPPELQGQTIRNSPIPFVFGANPADLQQRYWLRVITPPQFQQTEIWLEAYPRYRADVASFTRSIIRFNLTDFSPVALRRYLPTGQYDSYKFENISVNPILPNWQELFSPTVPRGWQLVRENPPAAASNSANAAAAAAGQRR
ncbi:MAG: hypothetical protein DWQ42_10990 [Planctomycetota bacterium]|nr:MAG: hypothetical protein DWQ42_10990 [Planctomycetota bacterium]